MPHPESSEALRLDRRNLLRSGIGAVGASLTRPHFLTELSDRRESLPSLIGEIRDFETGIGERPLTFPEAQAYIPLVTALYAETIHPDGSAVPDNDAIYLVRAPEENPMQDVLNGGYVRLRDGGIIHSRTIEEFVAAYPDVPLSSQAAQVLLTMSYFLPSAEGVTRTDGIFLFLDTLNDPAFAQIQPAYTGRHPQAACRESTPAIRFRSALLHELGHAENTKLKKHGRKHGFMDDRYPQTTPIEEFVIDYTQGTINTSAGLSYTTSYKYTPRDFANFEQMLHSSHLSLSRLTELRRNARLGTYLQLLNRGAGTPVMTNDTDTLLQTDVVTALTARNDRYPDWQILAHYYPDIDTSDRDVCTL